MDIEFVALSRNTFDRPALARRQPLYLAYCLPIIKFRISIHMYTTGERQRAMHALAPCLSFIVL